MDKKQAYIYIGGPVCAADHPDAVPVTVAATILSNRLSSELREKQGLAYSIGASVTFDRGFGWLMASMGTGKENYEQAKSGILEQMTVMKRELVTDEELQTAVNSIWGSMLTARLSRINQAFYMAVNQFLGRGFAYEDDFIQRMEAVSKEDIKRVAEDYFDTRNYVLATAGVQ